MKSIFIPCRWLAVPLLATSFLLQMSCSDSLTGSGSRVNGADPGVLEAPIAFVKRPIPLDEDDEELQLDLREPTFFTEGGDVYIRSNSTATATETNITSAITTSVPGGRGDVKDLSPSFDGNKLLFSLRMFDPNPDDDDTPTWNIYEYDLETATLRRIIDSFNDITAELGDDVAPAYLPDGRIIFSSNRQTQSVEMLTNEFKKRFRAVDEDGDQMTMTLHVMRDDGSELQQITYNQSHDLYPSVLTRNYSGEVVFTRWDNAAGNNAMHLYKTTPEGTDVQVLYGVHSHRTGANNAGTNDANIQFSRPVEMEDGRIMVIARPYTNTYGGGDILMIDVDNYANNTQAVNSLPGFNGPAQRSATINNISAAEEISTGGRYSAAWPLWDGSNRMLVSKSVCILDINGITRPCIEPYLSDPVAVEVSPAYSIWLYDLEGHAEKVIVPAEQSTVITDIVAMQARPALPAIIQETDLNLGWIADGLGAIHIESVYDFGEGTFNGCFYTTTDCHPTITDVTDFNDPANATADERPARFVRIVKAVSQPGDDNPDLENPPDLARTAFGPQFNLGMVEIIGYAPVEPDGSVKVKVPANVALGVSVLDSMGRRIGPRHHNWFSVRPGDTMECTGCHTENTAPGDLPNIHHRRDAEAASINSGITGSGVLPNTEIPGTGLRYTGSFGETMAEVRFNSVGAAVPPAIEPQVNVNLEYEDYWTDTDPAAPATPTDPFSWLYANLDTAQPVPNSCQDPATWDYRCRVVINYEQHIHPLWALPRMVDTDMDTIPDLDVTCITCHTNVDAMAAAMVPDGQLDLTDGVSDLESDHFKSYEELFSTDTAQVLNGGVLENITTQIPVDTDGDGIDDSFDTIDDPAAAVAPTMSGNGARASFFVEKMSSATATRNGSLPPTDMNYVDHSGFMTPDELRLIIEWLDIGAQYFNDPFDLTAPMN